MDKRFFFASFFRSSHIEFPRRRNSILTTGSKRAHSKIVGYPFQDESLMIQSFSTRFEIQKTIINLTHTALKYLENIVEIFLGNIVRLTEYFETNH